MPDAAFAAKLETMFAGASNRLSDPHQIDQDCWVTLNEHGSGSGGDRDRRTATYMY